MHVNAFPSHARIARAQVMEDVWLGSVLHRSPPAAPVRYVSLLGGRGGSPLHLPCISPASRLYLGRYVSLLGGRGGLYVDAWDMRLTRSAMLVHVITKQVRTLELIN